MSSQASAWAIWAAPTSASAAMAMVVAIFFTSFLRCFLFSLTSRIHFGELGDSPTEFLLCRKLSREIGRDQILGEPGADDLCADAHHVDVVMLDALMRGMDIVAHRGTNAFHLVGADRGTDAGAADHQA